MKVLVIGSGRGCFEYRNLTEGREVWACFSAIGFLRENPDLAFCLDTFESFDKTVEKNPEFERLIEMRDYNVKKIRKLKIPILFSKRFKNVSTSKEYPLKEIVAKFGVTYFSCSLAYIIAYALYKGVKDLLFVGTNMDYKTKWIDEKGGVEFWLGYAKAKGVRVRFHGKYSKLLKTKSGRLYGYDIFPKDVI